MCPFCSLSEQDKHWLLFQNEHWLVFMADRQNYPGRCLVMSREHIEALSELSSDQWKDLKQIIDSLEILLKCKLGADCINWSCLMNDAYKESEPHPHLHFHVIPRYSKPVIISGHKFVDRRFGHHYDKNAKKIDKEFSQEVFEQLKSMVKYYL